MAELVNNKMPVAVHICQFFQRTGTCKFGDSCRFSHDVSPRHAPRSQVCDLFRRTGNCKFGDQCRFSHDQRPAKPEVCRMFQTTGLCKFGARCRFSHAVEDKNAVPADGWTAMHQAAWAGDTRTLARLLVSQLELAQVSAR